MVVRMRMMNGSKRVSSFRGLREMPRIGVCSRTSLQQPRSPLVWIIPASWEHDSYVLGRVRTHATHANTLSLLYCIVVLAF